MAILMEPVAPWLRDRTFTSESGPAPFVPPADVLITVDAGRLWRAEQLGLFQPVKSKMLDARIPESFREPAGQWFGFSQRARVIAYNKDKVRPGEIETYEGLADPKWKGRVCMRSSTNIYNLSLMGALLDHLGEQKAESWAKAVRANLAQEPKGGDTDQLKAVAAGSTRRAAFPSCCRITTDPGEGTLR